MPYERDNPFFHVRYPPFSRFALKSAIRSEKRSGKNRRNAQGNFRHFFAAGIVENLPRCAFESGDIRPSVSGSLRVFGTRGRSGRVFRRKRRNDRFDIRTYRVRCGGCFPVHRFFRHAHGRNFREKGKRKKRLVPPSARRNRRTSRSLLNGSLRIVERSPIL